MVDGFDQRPLGAACSKHLHVDDGDDGNDDGDYRGLLSTAGSALRKPCLVLADSSLGMCA